MNKEGETSKKNDGFVQYSVCIYSYTTVVYA